jgi:pimeloyl-ACP methyl ester carboxylesterase
MRTQDKKCNMRQALIYLPGIDGTGRLLHRQPRLFEEYETHCVSYPQYEPATYDQLADLGAAALQESSGSKPGVVLAESFGGAVALTLALRRPDLVERLVLVNTFAFFPRRGIIKLASWFSPFLPAKPSHPATRGVRGMFFFAPDIPPAERAEWWTRTADVPLSAYGLRLPMIAGLDLRSRLAAIHVPTLVLASTNDRVVSPSAGRELARLLPRARLLQMAVGHAALIHPRVDVAEWLRSPFTE